MSDGLIRSYIFRRERPFKLPGAFMEIIQFTALRRSSNASREQT
jgi:hypothetical protein